MLAPCGDEHALKQFELVLYVFPLADYEKEPARYGIDHVPFGKGDVFKAKEHAV